MKRDIKTLSNMHGEQTRQVWLDEACVHDVARWIQLIKSVYTFPEVSGTPGPMHGRCSLPLRRL